MTQQTKSKKMDEKYVVFHEENDKNEQGYYEGHIRDGETTICGRSVEGDYRTGDNLGPIPLCDECARRDPDQDIREIAETIADVVPGFEFTFDSPPSYLNKEQLTVLRDWIVEMQERAESQEGGSS